MIGLSQEQAAKYVLDAIAITREDIARAKTWILTTKGSNTQGMVDDWLRQQGIADLREVDTDAEDCKDSLATVARAYSIRLAYYQATWELIGSGFLVSYTSTGHWDPPLGYKTSRGGGGIPVEAISCPYPERIYRLPSASTQPADADVFLSGIDRKAFHSGILEAIEQSLTCFRRGLYLPATVMLAAAAEATWMECGGAVATNLSDPKLSGVLADSFVSIAKIVSVVRRALETKSAKPLLQKAGLTIHQVVDAEIWTTALRDRRNALHWGKAKSFIADHSETGTLLMAAPQHLGTLESIRVAC